MQFKFYLILKYTLTKENPANLITVDCSVETFKKSVWERGTEWLVTQRYSSQGFVSVVISELVTDINLVAPAESQVDLSLFSTFVKAQQVMILFCNLHALKAIHL